jgi:hypothetical protein
MGANPHPHQTFDISRAASVLWPGHQSHPQDYQSRSQKILQSRTAHHHNSWDPEAVASLCRQAGHLGMNQFSESFE